LRYPGATKIGVGFLTKAMQGYALPAVNGRQFPQVCPTGHAGGTNKINK
jgi:hypothetical protein